MNILEQNDQLGFYMVGEEKHHVKPQALIRATETGHFPEWNFNRSIFDSVNWLEEPEA
jgi:hypothetical protein